MYAKMILDSINKEGQRLVTIEVEYPTCIQAQINTHRMISKNSASQRAIPLSKFLKKVPKYVPAKVGKYSKGMESQEYFQGESYEIFCKMWNELEATVASKVEEINDYFKIRYGVGIAKEIINRPLSPFRYSKSILTANKDRKGWDNFLRLRCASDAQSDIAMLANMIRDEIDDSKPDCRKWHLPYAQSSNLEDRIIESVTTCAKISYRRDTVSVARSLFKHLAESGHWSPFEHQAVDLNQSITGCCLEVLTKEYDLEMKGNFYPAQWLQLRKLLDLHTTHMSTTQRGVFKEFFDLGIEIERLQQIGSDDQDTE
jgi:thymidylate synthase ThyX